MQLIPDLIEIFILLFADDVILVSDAVRGLQNQLNVLFDTANRLSLFVNIDKNNGEPIAMREKGKYVDTPMEIVNMYKCLGIHFSTRLSFSHALNNMSQRA